MRAETVKRIHARLKRDLGGTPTPAARVFDAEELARMEKRLWGPLARAHGERELITPRWTEYGLDRRREQEALMRRRVTALIDTFWAGYPDAERRGLEADVMDCYLDPEEVLQAMPFTPAFVVHQAVHLITSDEEFTARLVSHLIATPLEAFGKRRVPAGWSDPVAREAFDAWWGRFMESRPQLAEVLKDWRGRRLCSWLGARVLALHREGRPLAGRFGDLYLFLRSRLPPSAEHLRWIDAAAAAFSVLRAAGDARPLEDAELEACWKSAPEGPAGLKAGCFELARRGGFVTQLYFGAES